MCKFAEISRGILEPYFVIGVAKGRDIVGHHQHLFNFSSVDAIMYQSIQKVQPPCTEHVVCEGEVIISKGPNS